MYMYVYVCADMLRSDDGLNCVYMYVCMYVYVYMYVCMYVCMYMYVYVCMCMCRYASI